MFALSFTYSPPSSFNHISISFTRIDHNREHTLNEFQNFSYISLTLKPAARKTMRTNWSKNDKMNKTEEDALEENSSSKRNELSQ